MRPPGFERRPRDLSHFARSRFIATLVLGATASFLAPSLGAAQVDTLEDLDQVYHRATAALAAHDTAGYVRLSLRMRELAPSFPPVLAFLAEAYARTGRRQEALALLRRLAAMGETRDPSGDSAFAPLAAGGEFRRVAAAFARNRAPVSRSTTAFTLPDPDLLPEALVYDSADGSFYVGSLAKHKVVRRRGYPPTAGEWHMDDFAGSGDGLFRVVGIKVDHPRRQLWFATWASERDSVPGPGRFARTRLFRYDLRTGALLKRYEPSDTTRGHLLNDLVITRAGDVYVTDTDEGAVYRVMHDADTLERFVRPDPRRYVGANGIAITPDERRLYVAFAQGIAVVDVPTRRVAYLDLPADVSTSVVDGLYWHRSGLIAVQTLPTLERVVRFPLDASGRRVLRADVLERANPHFQRPTTGALVGDTLYYIANSQYNRLTDAGTLRADEPGAPTVILRLDLAGRPR